MSVGPPACSAIAGYAASLSDHQSMMLYLPVSCLRYRDGVTVTDWQPGRLVTLTLPGLGSRGHHDLFWPETVTPTVIFAAATATVTRPSSRVGS